ncbi:MAG TPA: 50S ribosomal protein L22 [Pyrinomonadaceae bacterium]|nr:50S ribosomal protein L22 [Pyrinomonadaceae bacterium]
MEARASAKYLRGSAQKARLVVDMIRGRRVGEALAVLRHTNKRAADGIEKCVRSAIANATEMAEKQNIAVDPDDLWVKACFVDMGPTKNRRRMRPAPQGRAYREQRHFCHVTVLVSSDERETARGRGTAGKKVKNALSGDAATTTGKADAKRAPRTAAKKTASKAAKNETGETTAAADTQTQAPAETATTEE